MGEENIRRIMVLGSVPSLGPVMLFDDMEQLLKWVATGTGADFTVEKSQVAVYNGDYSLHLATKTTDPGTGDYVVGKRRLFARPGRRYRLEFLFEYSSATVEGQIGCEVDIFDGTYAHKCGIRYGVAAERWYYLDSGGGWAWLEAVTKCPNPACFHRLLVEWDEASGKYIRMVFDSVELDMSGMGYHKAGSTGALWLDLLLYVETYAEEVGHGYFEDVLLMEI